MLVRLFTLLGPATATAEAKSRAIIAPGADFVGIPPVVWPWVILGSLLLVWYYVFRRQ